jgi:hypothetical protein
MTTLSDINASLEDWNTGIMGEKSQPSRWPAKAASLIEQETLAAVLTKGRAMTKSKIQMSNECQSSKSKTFGIEAWDLIWHLSLELWHSTPIPTPPTYSAGRV